MFDDCLKPEWHDMSCFFKIRRPISEDYIDGFANLRYRHQVQIREKLGKKHNFRFAYFVSLLLYLTHCVLLEILSGYDINGISIVEHPPTKNCKLNNLELEKQIEFQNKEFFAVYDKIEEFIKRGGDCWAILEANNQFIPESDADVRFKWAIKPIERLFFLTF